MNTYLILNHRIANILDESAEFTRILGVIEKPFNIPLFLQWGQILTDVSQFPANPRVKRGACTLRVCSYSSNIFLLPCSLMSPSETGWQSLSASALTRGANDSIVCLFAFVRWGADKRRE